MSFTLSTHSLQLVFLVPVSWQFRSIVIFISKKRSKSFILLILPEVLHQIHTAFVSLVLSPAI